jgi:hypothetical protein
MSGPGRAEPDYGEGDEEQRAMLARALAGSASSVTRVRMQAAETFSTPLEYRDTAAIFLVTADRMEMEQADMSILPADRPFPQADDDGQ